MTIRWVSVLVFGALLTTVLLVKVASIDAVGGAVNTPSDLRAQLVGRTINERASIVADEILRTVPTGQFAKRSSRGNDITVEIVKMEKIEGGIAVFARAWKDGNQIGFGSDGTVEIERFKIFNPQFTVESPDGDIIQTITRFDGTRATTTAKVDVRGAIQDELIHTISIVGKDGSQIIAGKVGNTTSTFNPVSGANSPVDGWAFTSDQTSWNAAHDDVNANIASPTVTDDIMCGVRKASASSNFIIRSAYLFDTSSIPDGDTISSATFSVRGTAATVGDNDGNDFCAVVTSALAATNNVTGTDFDNIGSSIDNPTEMHDASERKDLSTISTSAYTDWTFNATGISNISKTGISQFGLREGHDILDDVPATTATYTYLGGRYADDTNGTPPKLVVVHSGVTPEATTTPATAIHGNAVFSGNLIFGI